MKEGLVMIDLAIHVSRDADWQVVTLKGELDDHQSDKLNQLFNELIQDRSSTQIILDLTHVTFIDSVGIGSIAIAGKKMSQLPNGQLHLVSNQSTISKMIELSGIVAATKETIRLFDSLDSAKKPMLSI